MGDMEQNTYLYRYSYVFPGEGGALHGSETFLLFGLAKDLKANPVVADNLVDFWTRFAKTGDPNGGVNVTWPQYTRGDGRYLDINNVSTVMTGY
jgi:para-nitrobenzyl esterase